MQRGGRPGTAGWSKSSHGHRSWSRRRAWPRWARRSAPSAAPPPMTRPSLTAPKGALVLSFRSIAFAGGTLTNRVRVNLANARELPELGAW